jgi:hypothetical protein
MRNLMVVPGAKRRALLDHPTLTASPSPGSGQVARRNRGHDWRQYWPERLPKNRHRSSDPCPRAPHGRISVPRRFHASTGTLRVMRSRTTGADGPCSRILALRAARALSRLTKRVTSRSRFELGAVDLEVYRVWDSLGEKGLSNVQAVRASPGEVDHRLLCGAGRAARAGGSTRDARNQSAPPIKLWLDRTAPASVRKERPAARSNVDPCALDGKADRPSRYRPASSAYHRAR